MARRCPTWSTTDVELSFAVLAFQKRNDETLVIISPNFDFIKQFLEFLQNYFSSFSFSFDFYNSKWKIHQMSKQNDTSW